MTERPGLTARRHNIMNLINGNKANLHQDIQDWLGALVKDPSEPGSAIIHHIGQFNRLCDIANTKMQYEYDQRFGNRDPDDRAFFLTLIDAVLSSQWLLLRELAEQRLGCSPYRDALGILDDLTGRWYICLKNALKEVGGIATESADGTAYLSPPMVRIGSNANITLVANNAPSMLGLPFGAVQEVTRPPEEWVAIQAIPHEISHNVFDNISGLFCEINFRLGALFNSADLNLTPKKKLIRGRILAWLREIVADLGGTAIGEFNHADSAIKLLATPDDAIDVSDEEHPVPILRPWVHYWLLELLVAKDPLLNEEVRQSLYSQLKKLKEQLDLLDEGLMDRRMRYISDLVLVSLGDVKQELYETELALLSVKLDALNGATLFDVLLKTWQTVSNYDKYHFNTQNLPCWGDAYDKDGDFVLRLTEIDSWGSSLPVREDIFDFLCAILRMKGCP